MAITLISGTPGAGKTTLAMEMLCEATGLKPRDYKTAEALFEALRQVRPPRPIFTWNVTGLADDLPFKKIGDLLEWETLPDGALVLGDEAWESFGTQTGANRDPRALNLAKHRHRGMDFIFTVQHPSQLSTFLRSLVGEHIHLSRRFGTKLVERFSWSAVCEDPNSVQQRKRGSGGVPWTYHAPVQELYRSATIHTVKRKIPLRVLALPVLALAALGALVFGGIKVRGFLVTDATAAPLAQRSEQGGPVSRAGTETAPTMSAAEWIARQTPRVPGMPWSAPAFDGRPAVAEPRLFCYISYKDSEEGTCRCFTEQATRYLLKNDECRHIAENGEPYNPYRREGRILATDSMRPEHPERASAPGAVQAPQAAGVGAAHGDRAPGAVISAPSSGAFAPSAPGG